MDEAISTAKELKDKVGLGHALNWAAGLALLERNRAEVDRLASDLIELSTRTSLLFNLPEGVGKRGWARSTFGNT